MGGGQNKNFEVDKLRAGKAPKMLPAFTKQALCQKAVPIFLLLA